MKPVLIAAIIMPMMMCTPAHAYLLGPSCDDTATKKAFIAEAQCALVMCRGEPLKKSMGEIKALSAAQIDAILAEKQSAKAKKGEVPPEVTKYAAFVRGFATEMYVHLSRLNLAVSRLSEITHFKTNLTCMAEVTFSVAEAREALYNQIAVKVYSQSDNAAMLLDALANGDADVLERAKAANRPIWLEKIDQKLRSPRNITFVASQGPNGPIISMPKSLLMD